MVEWYNIQFTKMCATCEFVRYLLKVGVSFYQNDRVKKRNEFRISQGSAVTFQRGGKQFCEHSAYVEFLQNLVRKNYQNRLIFDHNVQKQTSDSRESSSDKC